MEKNSIATIYEDPITETRVEGRAKLIKKRGEVEIESGVFIEAWEVKFLFKDGTPESKKFLRKIKRSKE